ncbi:MAG: histidine phosphatase family protein [Alphaproteobacteria bacterium]
MPPKKLKVETVCNTQSIIFITHADVIIDPNVPVPEWVLSEKGKQRHKTFNRLLEVANVVSVYCSAENKAIEAARIHANALNIIPETIGALHENDRSSTGFLPPEVFEETADTFFAYPNSSVCGWERASDSQRRIVSAIDKIIGQHKHNGNIAIVSHGGVGTLLLCHITGIEISRKLDQPGTGGGNYFRFSIADMKLIHGWRDISPRQD